MKFENHSYFLWRELEWVFSNNIQSSDITLCLVFIIKPPRNHKGEVLVYHVHCQERWTVSKCPVLIILSSSFFTLALFSFSFFFPILFRGYRSFKLGINADMTDLKAEHLESFFISHCDQLGSCSSILIIHQATARMPSSVE